jgi:arylsulfatase A-like enzyme
VRGRTAAAAALALVVALPGCGGGRPHHLVLVTVDTLRADHLGAYGDRRGLTPALDALAGASEVFDAAYSAAPFTLPSVSSLLTSRWPEEIGMVSNDTVLPRGVPTLARRLRRRGWRTAAVVSNFILRPAAGLDRGFAVYDASYPGREAHRDIPERIAPATTDAALAALERLVQDGPGPVFLWVHYQDPHGPYLPPDDLRARFIAAEKARPDAERWLPAHDDDSGMGGIPHYQYEAGHHDPAWYRAGYAGEIAYADREIGRLLAGVASLLPADETVLVFTADHGEGLGEDDYWFTHGQLLTDAFVHVPLFVRAPGLRAWRRTDVAAHVDVVPTVLTLLGVPPLPGARGRDLHAGTPATVPYFAALAASSVPRFGLVHDGFTYVVEEGPGGVREDVVPDGADAARRAALRGALRTLRDGLAPSGVAKQAVTSDDRARLRALGYAGD